MDEKEKKVGPNLHTHQAGVVDLNKTIVRNQAEKIEEQERGHGTYDSRGKTDEE
jgi:hypothetical protein